MFARLNGFSLPASFVLFLKENKVDTVALPNFLSFSFTGGEECCACTIKVVGKKKTSVGVETRCFASCHPLGVGSETLHFFHVNYMCMYCGLGSEMLCFLSLLVVEAQIFASTATTMERTIRFKNHNMFEGIVWHIVPTADCHLQHSQLKRASCFWQLQIAPSELSIKIPMLRQTFAKLPGKEHPV